MKPSPRVLVALLALVGCATPAAKEADPSPTRREILYTVAALVLQDSSHGPGLCSTVGYSHPPRCSAVPITNWAWDAVDGERRAADAIWGVYEVAGTYAEAAFTLARPPAPASETTPTSQRSDFDTPCDEPADGWTSPDPSRASDEDRAAAIGKAREFSNFSGVWVDEDILNVAFTGRLDDREKAVRELWGGPLCIVRHEHTSGALERVADELTEKAEDLFDVQLLGAEADDVANVVRLDVVLAARDTQSKLDEAYGEGVVVVHSWLRPV